MVLFLGSDQGAKSEFYQLLLIKKDSFGRAGEACVQVGNSSRRTEYLVKKALSVHPSGGKKGSKVLSTSESQSESILRIRKQSVPGKVLLEK